MIVELSPRTRASRSRQSRAKWPVVVILLGLIFVCGAAWLVVQH